MISDFSYALTPFLAWSVAGAIKFVINSMCQKRLAFGLIGYGGMPSNHSAIVSSTAAQILFKEGFNHPAFALALTLAFIVMLDAGGLRGHVGRQAAAINKLSPEGESYLPLRERIGHSRLEITVGVAVGISVAALVRTVLG